MKPKPAIEIHQFVRDMIDRCGGDIIEVAERAVFYRTLFFAALACWVMLIALVCIHVAHCQG